jgi:pyruvyltransferase
MGLLNKTIARFKPPLKLYWWRFEYPDRLNFGDEITPWLIERLWGRRCIWSPPSQCELAGTGSIIEILQELSDGNQVNVWGSGFIKLGTPNKLDNLVFHAVRGELSSERVGRKGKLTLGDPGLLASIALPKNLKAKKYDLGLVPHYIDQEHPAIIELSKTRSCKVINVLDTPEKVLSEISSCSLVLSSSMHGLIISDSYSIPNYWISLNALTGGEYKFNDYYSLYGEKPPLLNTMEALSSDKIEELISKYNEKPIIQDIQKGLINAFPY